ncbi:DinB family protein [Tamilnaduibacter salinus]|nr:DinB family protein [Tamilnaduibacter salinus]
MLNDIVEENAHAIGQLIELLTHLPNNLYRQSFGQRGRHAIGKHVRHIIDHYSALLSATASPQGLLDYENRDRDQSLETDCRAGANQLSAILHSLRRRFVEHHSAELAMLHTSDEQGQVIATSVDRELVFLASHTIHHMAIIGMLAEQAGVEISDEFGVHPSTLRHLQRQQRPMARSA